MLTQDEVFKLIKIIDDNSLVYIARHIGADYLKNEEIANLKKAGIDVYKLYDPTKDIILQNFYFGLISDAIEKAKAVSFKDLKAHFERGENIPLTQIEKQTIQSIKKQFLGDISAHRGRIFQDVNNIISQKEKQHRGAYEKVIRDEIKRGAVEKLTYGEVARELGHKTGDWSRNFGRIVEYVSHYALNEGKVSAYERGDPNSKIWFDVFPGACDYCVTVFLTAGVGSQPKIFTIAELKANGTNIGRKAKDYKATISPVHPHCRCTANKYFEPSKWDAKERSFVAAKSDKVVDRPKLNFTFNGKEYSV